MRALAVMGISLVVVFAVLHLLGLRDDAGFLSGAPVSHPIGGVLYVLSYFAAIVVAPVLLLAAGLLAITARRRTRSRLPP